jgi:hypothetical protein
MKIILHESIKIDILEVLYKALSVKFLVLKVSYLKGHGLFHKLA